MNVYDFDDTIYDGESVFDFYLFCLRKKPGMIRYIPFMVRALIRYKRCKITAEELISGGEKYIRLFFESFPAPKALIVILNNYQLLKQIISNMKKIKKIYLDMQKEDDVVISASWDELIGEACRRIGIKNVIASSIDHNGCSLKVLCYGENKVKIFKEKFPGIKPENFYTDSKNDQPMIEFSENAYFVEGDDIKKIK